VRFVSKRKLHAIARENPKLSWHCGPIGEFSEFSPPPGTIAICFQMLDAAISGAGTEESQQCGSYFAVAPNMTPAEYLVWKLKNTATDDLIELYKAMLERIEI
jgi:hypothetical protein